MFDVNHKKLILGKPIYGLWHNNDRQQYFGAIATIVRAYFYGLHFDCFLFTFYFSAATWIHFHLHVHLIKSRFQLTSDFSNVHAVNLRWFVG